MCLGTHLLGIDITRRFRTLTKVFPKINHVDKRQRTVAQADHKDKLNPTSEIDSREAKLFKTRAFGKQRILNRCQKHHKANPFAAGRFAISQITLSITGSLLDRSCLRFTIVGFGAKIAMFCGARPAIPVYAEAHRTASFRVSSPK